MMYSNSQENVLDFKRHISVGKTPVSKWTKLLSSQHILKAWTITEVVYDKGLWTNTKPTPETHCTRLAWLCLPCQIQDLSLGTKKPCF